MNPPDFSVVPAATYDRIGETSMIVREFFSTSAQVMVAILLFATLIYAVYNLWDIAIRRWFS